MKRVVRLLTVSAAVATVVGGCRARPKAAGEGPYADKVANDVPQIERALGVKYKRPPKLEIRSRQQVREFLLQKLEEPDVKTAIAGQEATYKLLGLIPDTMKLNAFFVKVLTEQIIGYYDPRTKVLYVVDGAPEEYVGITIMHELVHALQDQYVNLDSLEHLTGDDDRQTAVQAVIEGQATYEQVYLMAGGNGNIAAQLPGGWESLRSAIRDAQSTQPIFASAPMVIQESLLFPYINGADFVRRFLQDRKGQMVWSHLPVSTEQVMHDRAFFANPPDVPSEIKLPAVPQTLDANDFGEFGTRLFLYQHIKDQDASIRDASGWDGDRYVLAKTAAGNAFAWVTVWDTPVDAAEFVSALDDVMMARYNVKPTISPGGVRRFRAATRTVDVSSRDIGGRSVVLYVDVPAGSSTSFIDLTKVQVVPR